MGRAFDAVGRRAVGGDVKGLVGVPRIVEVIGSEELVLRVDGVVHAAEESAVVDVVIYRQALILVVVGLVEVDQHLTLTIAVGIDLGVGDVRAKDGIGDRAWGRTHGGGVVRAQVGTLEVFEDAFSRAKIKELVLDDGSARAAAELLAMEVGQGRAVGEVGGECRESLVVEQAAVEWHWCPTW